MIKIASIIEETMRLLSFTSSFQGDSLDKTGIIQNNGKRQGKDNLLGQYAANSGDNRTAK